MNCIYSMVLKDYRSIVQFRTIQRSEVVGNQQKDYISANYTDINGRGGQRRIYFIGRTGEKKVIEALGLKIIEKGESIFRLVLHLKQ